mgnify:CR=1 FL=1
MNNEILKSARAIVNEGHLALGNSKEFVLHSATGKALVLLNTLIRKEHEKLNGKNIYCQHGVTACDWGRDNHMRLDYDYKTTQEEDFVGGK